VTAFVLRNSGTQDDAEDMLQEALVILWERVRSGRFEYYGKT
jgi:DNA-directed RNA polymerase specialized sigma24 family protein